ncbi:MULTISPECIES: glycoside hydrolase family 30 beta sandwich domain-containing protein [unclassified Lentimonas]|nr:MULTISPECIES: glycoside hydrolase family 30 beta sandwich domain-containing protein [unclassified Lentimonas]
MKLLTYAAILVGCTTSLSAQTIAFTAPDYSNGNLDASDAWNADADWLVADVTGAGNVQSTGNHTIAVLDSPKTLTTGETYEATVHFQYLGDYVAANAVSNTFMLGLKGDNLSDKVSLGEPGASAQVQFATESENAVYRLRHGYSAFSGVSSIQTTFTDGDDLEFKYSITLGSDAASSSVDISLSNLTAGVDTGTGTLTGIDQSLYDALIGGGAYLYLQWTNGSNHGFTGAQVNSVIEDLNATEEPPAEVLGFDVVDSWKSGRYTGYARGFLDLQDEGSMQTGSGSHASKVTIDVSDEHQPIVGFGASMTEASAKLIYESPDRNEIMDKLFDPQNGIGLSLVRIPMGSSDFSLDVWSYEDTEGEFTLERDLAYTIPLLKQALQLNPDLKLTAVPWSAPGWMKSNGVMEGGSVKSEHYDEYANYFVDFIQGYEAEGLPIWSVSPQNEPEHSTNEYPSTWMTAAHQIDVIAEMTAAFNANDIDTKIICFDHNYDIGEDYVNTVYADSDAFASVIGSAWHQYGGKATSMGAIADAYPSKGVYLTERTGSNDRTKTQKYQWSSNFNYFMGDIFYNALINDSQTLLTWNMAIDETGGPRLPAVSWGQASGLIEYSTNGTGNNLADDSYRLWAEFAALGHYSMVVKPGAVRIGVTVDPDFNDKLYVTAFKNTDGSVAVVAYNKNNYTVDFDIELSEQHLAVSIGEGEAVTYLMNVASAVTNAAYEAYMADKPGDELLKGFDADLDGDGLANGLEMAFGLDASDPADAAEVPVGSIEGSQFYVQTDRVDGIAYGAKGSWDLDEWFPVDQATVGDAVRFSLDTAEQPVGFLQWMIELSAE